MILSDVLEERSDGLFSWGWRCRRCWAVGRATDPSLRAECRECGQVNALFDVHIFRYPVRSAKRTSVMHKNLRTLQVGVLKEYPRVFGEAATKVSRSTYKDWHRLASIVFPCELESVKGWFVQVFLDGNGRYVGTLSHDFVICGLVDVMKKEVAEMKQFQLRLDPTLHRWLKAYAANNGTTMTEVLTAHIRTLKAREQAAIHVRTL